MQFFCFLSQRMTGRALGLFLAYVLVAQSMLMPLRAIATATDGHGFIICVTESVLSQAVLKKDPAALPLDPAMSHDCDMGCVMQGSKVAAYNHEDVFTRLNFEIEISVIRIIKALNVNGRPPSILASGKAPGAPPAGA
jgi:hypothetical protein